MFYRPTSRVLAVLELLQSHGQITGPDLARRLEVNIRTVRDYIETLQDLGIPVEGTRGRYGAYRLKPGYKLPPMIFSEEEAQALALSMLVGRKFGLTLTEPAFESVLAKIERVLPEATRSRVQAIGQTLIFESSAFQSPPRISAVATLSSAFQERRSVYLQYRSAGAEVTERVFDTYGVVYHESFWYTVGYCHLRQDLRLFRLDRLLKVELLEESFIRPESFDALPAVQKMLAVVPSVWRVEVWFEASLEEVQPQFKISKAFFEESGEGVILRGEVEDLEWMARKLAGLGVALVVRQPEELRTVLHRYALKLAGYAERREIQVIFWPDKPTIIRY